VSAIHCPIPPPTKLHAGDHITASGYDVDLEVVSITDHTTDAIGQIVYELLGDDGHIWFLIGGVAIQGGVR
jgi:hypothetical protein